MLKGKKSQYDPPYPAHPGGPGGLRDQGRGVVLYDQGEAELPHQSEFSQNLAFFEKLGISINSSFFQYKGDHFILVTGDWGQSLEESQVLDLNGIMMGSLWYQGHTICVN